MSFCHLVPWVWGTDIPLLSSSKQSSNRTLAAARSPAVHAPQRTVVTADNHATMASRAGLGVISWLAAGKAAQLVTAAQSLSVAQWAAQCAVVPTC
eukprot:COSAG01_NODE_13922_length_1517_cov_1.812412_1_plen_95_part_10